MVGAAKVIKRTAKELVIDGAGLAFGFAKRIKAATAHATAKSALEAELSHLRSKQNAIEREIASIHAKMRDLDEVEAVAIRVCGQRINP